MTPDEAIEKARWYAREDIATTLRESANVLADEVERLRERVARLEEALRDLDEFGHLTCIVDPACGCCTKCDARAALKGTP